MFIQMFMYRQVMVIEMVKLNLQYENPDGKGYRHEIFDVDFLNTKGFCIFSCIEENNLVVVIDKNTKVELDFGKNWIQATITDNINLI